MELKRLVLEVVPGLESVACGELEENFGLEGSPLLPGRVVVPLAPEDVGPVVRALSSGARCLDRVGILLRDERGAGTLEEIGELAASVEFQRLWAAGTSFAVRARRKGRQSFHSPAIERTVGSAINRVLRAARGRPGNVDLESPDVVVRADLRDQRLLLWLDTTGYRALHRRSYREYNHMASMRPTVANLLLRLSGWTGEGALVDPFCGSATIPIEAALCARGRAPAEFRGEGWLWQRHPWLQEGPEWPPVPSGREGGTGALLILGVERYANHLQGGLRNAARAGVQEAITLYEGKAERLPDIVTDTGIDPAGGTVVTNPPFGRRVGDTSMLASLYGEAARACADVGVATIVTIAERSKPMEEALDGAGFELEAVLPVIYGSTPATVFKAVSRR